MRLMLVPLTVVNLLVILGLCETQNIGKLLNYGTHYAMLFKKYINRNLEVCFF